jgi:hypothetical protein
MAGRPPRFETVSLPLKIEDVNAISQPLPCGYADATRGGGMTFERVVFSMDRGVQGRGYGSETMREIMRRLRCIGCCRARLLVVPENPAATLYERMGFRTVGEDASGGCLVMEVVLRAASWAATVVQAMSGALTAWSRRGRRRMRLRLSPGPHAAMVIGVERGPPCPA